MHNTPLGISRSVRRYFRVKMTRRNRRRSMQDHDVIVASLLVSFMAVQLGKYSGSLGVQLEVCARKYVFYAKTILMCAEKFISRNISITSAWKLLYECENIYLTSQKLLGSLDGPRRGPIKHFAILHFTEISLSIGCTARLAEWISLVPETEKPNEKRSQKLRKWLPLVPAVWFPQPGHTVTNIPSHEPSWSLRVHDF